MSDDSVVEVDVNNDLHQDDVKIDTDITEQKSAPEDEAQKEGSDSISAQEAVSVDYEALVREDVAVLKAQFTELSELSDITELDNPLRYAALRDLGLSAEEAYLATRRRRSDNRSHLVATHSVRATSQNTMSDAELSAAREIFGDISDAQIRKLYKKVTKGN